VFGHEKLVVLLLNNGANLSVVSNGPGKPGHGYGPLEWAVQNKHENIVTLLLKHIEQNEGEKKAFVERYEAKNKAALQAGMCQGK